jgi:serine/threonine protein kinase
MDCIRCIVTTSFTGSSNSSDLAEQPHNCYSPFLYLSVHRDLHLNNILVTRTHFPDQPEQGSWEDSAKIADIGEGRHVVSKLSGAVLNASVEARDFHAPEVIASRTWTTASDVFAFGVIGCKLLDMRKELCPEKSQGSAISGLTVQSLHTGDADASLVARPASVVPLAVAEIISSALARDPAERWSIREYVDKLVELSMDFYAGREEPDQDKVQWTALDWWDVFEQAFSSRQAESSIWEHHGLCGEESSTWTLREDTPTY